MTELSTTYWFYLFPHVYPVVKNSNVLLLNTKDMNAIMFNEDGQVAKLVERLLDPVSFGVVEIISDSDKYQSCRHFFDKVCDHCMGAIIEVRPGMKKPSILTPYMLRMHTTTKGEIRKPGSNVTLVINNACPLDCSLCPEYFLQFKCCRKLQTDSFMDVQLIRDLVQDVSQAGYFIMNVCGGDITLHPQLDEIVKTLSVPSIRCRYHIHYRNCTRKINKLIDPCNIVVIVDFPIQAMTAFKPHENYTYNFIITKEADLESCRQFVKDHNIGNFYVSIIDTGKDTTFLKENTFMLQDNLACGSASLPFVDRVRIVNNHYFYRTFILPDGDVCGSSNGDVVANMYRNPISFVKDSINDFHTIQWNKTWENSICSNCLFHSICPLLSNQKPCIESLLS
ncbi:MAG: hypothetical protein WCQ69_08660 [Bacteroidales bacterium]|jgi:pseudo-rSAM protein|nr:hypothetical protein [Bacteroidales bacterium]MDD2264537.1 hypothetical protein [Bacteroidales bacterium]MDD2831772.1 hypothetical protein [Bacteroidales bacterium]MDD3209416.1 hypothetical protein [Bacteroidales bacterium]MDD3697778.1 hypothetical protein [Bacteroidales bacterium]